MTVHFHSEPHWKKAFKCSLYFTWEQGFSSWCVGNTQKEIRKWFKRRTVQKHDSSNRLLTQSCQYHQNTDMRDYPVFVIHCCEIEISRFSLKIVLLHGRYFDFEMHRCNKQWPNKPCQSPGAGAAEWNADIIIFNNYTCVIPALTSKRKKKENG